MKWLVRAFQVVDTNIFRFESSWHEYFFDKFFVSTTLSLHKFFCVSTTRRRIQFTPPTTIQSSIFPMTTTITISIFPMTTTYYIISHPINMVHIYCICNTNWTPISISISIKYSCQLFIRRNVYNFVWVPFMTCSCSSL